MDVKEALRKLCTQYGPSGHEIPAAETALELLRPLVDEVEIDVMGNVTGLLRCGKPNAKTLLLDAHLDEVGFMVANIEDGFLRFRSAGIDHRLLADREVIVCTEKPLFGVISCLAPHVQKAGDADKAPAVEELAIDIGMTQEEAQKAVPIGTPVVFRQPFLSLQGNRVCSKSLDDRSCFVILLRALELLREMDRDVDIVVLGSVCEEVGGWGAQTAAWRLAPDWCVAADVTFAQSPGVSEDQAPCKLGDGPAIGVASITPPWMSDRLKAKAKAGDIPYKVEVLSGFTGTNGDEFHSAREGIATAVVSLPLKYMHTPVEVIDLEDIEHTAKLLAAFAKDLGREAEVLC